eukprot:s33_g6.t1
MSVAELEPGPASSALLPDPLAGPLRAAQLFDEALRLIQGLRSEKTLAGSIGAVLLVKDRADADSLNLRIDEAYGTVDDAEAETNVEHACVAADIDGFVEQLEKMVQDILVVCVLPSADQEIQLELPCAAMERLQRCNVWFLSAQDAAVICTSDGPLRNNIQFEGMACNLPSQASMQLPGEVLVGGAAAATGAGVAALAQVGTLAATTNGIVYAVTGGAAALSIGAGFAVVASVGAVAGLAVGLPLAMCAQGRSHGAASQDKVELPATFASEDGGGAFAPGSEASNAWDGDPETFYDASAASGSFTAGDLQRSHTIGAIHFVARRGFTHSMIGGKFEVANCLSGPWELLHTIISEPLDNPLVNKVEVQAEQPFRFIRYLSPEGGHCTIASIRVYAA